MIRRLLRTTNASRRGRGAAPESARKPTAQAMMAKERHLLVIAERSGQPLDGLAETAAKLPEGRA